eukprot:COSAG06_NODE_2030_length_7782_cov_5.203429_4_plen_92_part_00
MRRFDSRGPTCVRNLTSRSVLLLTNLKHLSRAAIVTADHAPRLWPRTAGCFASGDAAVCTVAAPLTNANRAIALSSLSVSSDAMIDTNLFT